MLDPDAWSRRRVLADRLAAIAGEARWEALDLVARRGRELAVDLLRGRSAELYDAPSARAQLLAVALDQAADSLAAGRQVEVDLASFLRAERLPADAVAEVEARARRLRRAPADPDEAVFADQGLWADPRIMADAATRAQMLAGRPTAPRLSRLFRRSRRR